MPIVNRLLDAFFRTLDAVDMARERLDRALGRAPQPEQWASEWSPAAPAAPTAPVARRPTTVVPLRESAPADKPVVEAPRPKSAAKKIRTAGRTTTAAKIPAAKAVKPAKASTSKRASRKGSVDRKGADFDSPRARAIAERLINEGVLVVSADATHDGKKVLARVLWALWAAEQAGSELGLTAADASALLSLAAGLEVFATNIARACRDETTLIAESSPDGRSKRYTLTAAGREAAARLAHRAG